MLFFPKIATKFRNGSHFFGMKLSSGGRLRIMKADVSDFDLETGKTHPLPRSKR